MKIFASGVFRLLCSLTAFAESEPEKTPSLSGVARKSRVLEIQAPTQHRSLRRLLTGPVARRRFLAAFLRRYFEVCIELPAPSSWFTQVTVIAISRL